MILLRIAMILFLASTVHAQQYRQYTDLIKDVQALSLDTSAIFTIKEVFIEDGPMALSLDSGVIFKLQKLSGHRVAAYYVGQGTITFTPNLKQERLNLTRFYPGEVFNETVTSMAIIFTDDELDAMLTGPKANIRVTPELEAEAKSMVNDLLLEEDNKFIDDAIARGILNNSMRSTLYASINLKDAKSAIAVKNPYEAEPYRLYFKKSNGDFVFVSECPTDGIIPRKTEDGVEPSDLVKVEQHTMDVTFKGLDMTLIDNMSMEVLADSLLWFDMTINPYMTIDSIRLLNEEALTFHSPSKTGRIWVKLPSVSKRGQRYNIVVYAHGEMVDRYGDYTVLKSSITWYPSPNYTQLSFFDITFHHEKRFSLASIGKLTSTSTDNGIVTSRWVTGARERNASFHIGVFYKSEIPTEAGSPKATMMNITREQVDVVKLDVRQSLEFFSKLYGPLSIDHLYATEQPGTHGEAFPGMMHLSSYAFMKTNASQAKDFFGEQFTSHEVAHQWWGIAVDFNSYRDQWLSEGFAMYSCLLYSQLASRDTDKFFKLLEEYRTGLVRRGTKLIGEHEKAPVISLGYRARMGGTGADHNLYVYYKPAWVLHMIRNMTIDLNTMKEDIFMGIMKDFYMTYKGKHASTDDFKAIVEKHTQTDWSWFFDQWIHGNEIPTYRFAWKKEKLADGTWKIVARIKQEGTSDNFFMPIPVKIVTDNGSMRLRINMTGKEAVMDFPPIQFEPDEVVFNDLSSVLCTVKTEKF